jgi:hypothetical protein
VWETLSRARGGLWTFLALLLLFFAGPASAGKRRALLVGANEGWGEPELRYAYRDASKLRDVLVQRGRFAEEDIILLEDPTVEELREHLDEMKKEFSSASEEESLFIFYYSGHADSDHLHLQGWPRFSVVELLQYLRELHAAARLGILDACHSGSILKGGHPAKVGFEVSKNEKLKVRGLALLTSSTASEPSQESRELAGSFFTHYLVSGLFGLADVDADSKISLGEAYAHARELTAAATSKTRVGVQHPEARIEMAGHGDLHLTYLDGVRASLIFPPGSARCFLSDRFDVRLLAEITHGRTRRAVPVSPGTYILRCEVSEELLRVARVELKAGDAVEVDTQLTFYEIPRTESLIKGARPVQARSLLPIISGGALASGGVFWALAKQEQWRINTAKAADPLDPESEPRIDINKSVKRGETYQLLGFSLMGVGIVGLGVATGMHVLRDDNASVTMGVGTDGRSAFVHGTWP